MVSTPSVVLRWDRSIEDWNIAWVALATAPGAAPAPAAGLVNPASRAGAAGAESGRVREARGAPTILQAPSGLARQRSRWRHSRAAPPPRGRGRRRRPGHG